MGAQRHEVGAERLDVDIDVRRGLYGVDVQQHALAAANPVGDLDDRLERPDLVVGQHDRDEDRAVREGRLQLIGIDPAISIDRQCDDLEAELLEVAERVPDRMMLHGRGHDPVTMGLACPGRALEGKVVRLGPA